MRIKCIVRYDGTLFHGWQKQNNVRSVQEEIEKAIHQITHEENAIHSSGRTDAFVHANNQVFHFDSEKTIKDWKRAINHFLPNDIYIKEASIVDEEFHSRYSVKEKVYIYKLSTNAYNPFERNYIYQYPYGALDLELMKEAAQVFIGEHDFASFCVYDQYGNTIRTIYSFDIIEENGYFTFIVKGNGFRRYMVRLLVGSLIQVGAKRKNKQYIIDLLESCGQKKCLFKAEPQGLYLENVYYD